MHPINLMPMVKRFCAFLEHFVAIKHSVIMCDWSWIQNWKSRLPSPDQLGLTYKSRSKKFMVIELWITHFKLSLQVHEQDGTKNIVLHWQFQWACVQPFALWDFDWHSCHQHLYLDVVTCREKRGIALYLEDCKSFCGVQKRCHQSFSDYNVSMLSGFQCKIFHKHILIPLKSFIL